MWRIGFRRWWWRRRGGRCERFFGGGHVEVHFRVKGLSIRRFDIVILVFLSCQRDPTASCLVITSFSVLRSSSCFRLWPLFESPTCPLFHPFISSKCHSLALSAYLSNEQSLYFIGRILPHKVLKRLRMYTSILRPAGCDSQGLGTGSVSTRKLAISLTMMQSHHKIPACSHQCNPLLFSYL